ncbi:conserved Plasmodium protein, unknown function [Plasmodium gallinaceum]|uniref:Uncharacterized protein n=1 Tax=Plasmodium gallinaceum TaxID=5849 RepID=A0A1J1GV01_PLAGA|nr:conserved Plasmodium protein, unknown function [Plasmodium gallinaceum]CRG96343.1 conserved Plasmodium protein, unknown function [Plasmodium gallinaceum]
MKNVIHSIIFFEKVPEEISEKDKRNSQIEYINIIEEKNANKKKKKWNVNYIQYNLKKIIDRLRVKKKYNKNKCGHKNLFLNKYYLAKNKISSINLINFKFIKKKKKKKMNKLSVNENLLNINKKCVCNLNFNETNNLNVDKDNIKKCNFSDIDNSMNNSKKMNIYINKYIDNYDKNVTEEKKKEIKSRQYLSFLTSPMTKEKKKKTNLCVENSCYFSCKMLKKENCSSKDIYISPFYFQENFNNFPIYCNHKNKKKYDIAMPLKGKQNLSKSTIDSNVTKRKETREKINGKSKVYLNEENVYKTKKKNSYEENKYIMKINKGKQIKKETEGFIFNNNENNIFINELNNTKKLITHNLKKNDDSIDEIIQFDTIKEVYENITSNDYKNALREGEYDQIDTKYNSENDLKNIRIIKNSSYKFIELCSHEQIKPSSVNKHFKDSMENIETNSTKDDNNQLREESSYKNFHKKSDRYKKYTSNKNEININNSRCISYSENNNFSFYDNEDYHDITMSELPKERINKNMLKYKIPVDIERIKNKEMNDIMKKTTDNFPMKNDKNVTKEELINVKSPTIKFIKLDKRNNKKENNFLADIYNLKCVKKSKNEEREDELINYNFVEKKKEKKDDNFLSYNKDNKKKIIYNRIYKNYLKNKNKATCEFIKKNSFYSKQSIIEKFLYFRKDVENKKNKEEYLNSNEIKYSKDSLHKEKSEYFNSIQDIYHLNELKIKKKMKNLKKNRIAKLFVDNDNIYVKDLKIYTNEKRYKNVISNVSNIKITQREILSLPQNPVHLGELENYKCKLNRSIEIPALKIESEDINLFKYKNTWYELFFYNNTNNKETLYNYLIMRLNFELMINQVKDIVIIDKNTEHFNYPYIYNAYLIPPINVHEVENSLRIQKITSDNSFINKGSWNFLKIKNESNSSIKMLSNSDYIDMYDSFCSTKKNLYIPLKNYHSSNKDAKIYTSIYNEINQNKNNLESIIDDNGKERKKEHVSSFLENNIREKNELEVEKEIKRNKVKIDKNNIYYNEKNESMNNNLLSDTQYKKVVFLDSLLYNAPYVYMTFANSKIEPIFPYICENIFFLFEYYYNYLNNSIKHLKENSLKNKLVVPNKNENKDINIIDKTKIINSSREYMKEDNIKEFVDIKNNSIRKNLLNNKLNSISDYKEKYDSINKTNSVDINNFKIRNFINSKLYDSIFNKIRDKNTKKIKKNLDKEDVEIPIYLWIVFGGKDMKSMDSLNIVYKILRYATEIPPVEYEKYVRKLKRVKIKKNQKDNSNDNLCADGKFVVNKKIDIKRYVDIKMEKTPQNRYQQCNFLNSDIRKNIPNNKKSSYKHINKKNLSHRRELPELPKEIFCNKNLYNTSMDIYNRIVAYYNEYNNNYVVFGPNNYNEFLDMYYEEIKRKKKKKKEIKKEKEKEEKEKEKEKEENEEKKERNEKERKKNIYIDKNRKYLKSSEISYSTSNEENLFCEYFKKNKNISCSNSVTLNDCLDNLNNFPCEKNVGENEGESYDFFIEKSDESSNLSTDDELFNFISYHMQGRNPSFEKRKKNFRNDKLNYTDIYGPLIFKNKKKTQKVKYSFLLLDYPAYNNSIGHPSPLTFKTSALAALKEAIKEIKKTNGNKNICINIFGYSLGCSVSLQLLLDIAKSLYNDFFEDANKTPFEKKESEPIKEVKNEGNLYIKLNQNNQKINEYVYDEKKILTFQDIFIDKINSDKILHEQFIKRKNGKEKEKIKLENIHKNNVFDNISYIRNSDKWFDINNCSFYSSENNIIRKKYIDNSYCKKLDTKMKNELNNNNPIKTITINEILSIVKSKKKLKENILKNELKITINKVVLVAPFTNTQKLVKSVLKNSIFYLLSSFVMNKKCSYVHWDNMIVLKEFFKIINDFKKNKYLTEIFQNLTIDFIHGKKDTLVNYEMSLKLFKLTNKMIIKYSLNNIKCFLHIFENEYHSSILNSDSENRILQIIFKPLRLHPFSTINIHKFHFNLYKDMYLLKTVYLQYIANACSKRINM